MKKSFAFALCVYLSLWSWGLYLSYCHLYRVTELLSTNNVKYAKIELKVAIKQNPFQVVAPYYLAGLTSSSDPIEALRLYEQIEAKNPNFLLTHYFKSIIYRDLGLYSQAYTEICIAEKLYPLNETIQEEKKKYVIKRSQ